LDVVNVDSHICLGFKGKELELEIGGNSPTKVYAATTFEAGVWHDVILTYSSPNHRAAFFVDGKKAGEFAFTTANRVRIDAAQIGAWPGEDRNFQGGMSHFYVFPTVLSEDVIAGYFGAKG
jgi:hypothetical protein